MTEFQKGVRAMFDYLLNRAANNFHADPIIQAACEKENEIINDWAMDALENVDPESYKQWKSIEAAYQLGLKHGRNEKTNGRK